MSRDWRLYWHDVIVCCRKIERYTANMDRAAFELDDRTYDAVLRNLELIGEAVKQLPDAARSLAPTVEWRKIAGTRDILAHAYFGIDNDIIWDVISNEVPVLREAMEAIVVGPSK